MLSVWEERDLLRKIRVFIRNRICDEISKPSEKNTGGYPQYEESNQILLSVTYQTYRDCPRMYMLCIFATVGRLVPLVCIMRARNDPPSSLAIQADDQGDTSIFLQSCIIVI